MEKEKLIKNTLSYSVNVSNSKVDSLRVNNDLQTVIRVYDQGKIGIAGQIGDCDEGELLSRAQEKLSQGIPYPCNLPEGKERSENSDSAVFGDGEIVPACKSLLSRLSGEYPDFIFSNKINYEKCNYTYENSKDTSYGYRSDSVFISLVIKAAESANIMDLGYDAAQSYYNEDEIVSDIGKLLSVYRNKVELPENVPVLISYAVCQYIMAEVIAEKYVSGSSLLSGKLGQQVFNEKLSVYTDRSPKNKNNVAFFDDEGETNDDDKFYFVKDGVLCGLATYRRSAANFNLPVSGGARSDFDGVPTFGFAGTEILPTAEKIVDLVKGKAIYVALTSGGDMTPSGEVGLPVMLAYLYEDGKLVGTLPEFSLSANIFDILGKDFIGAVKNDVFDYSDETLIVANFKVNKQ
ncbi:MAG: metallopeptidase TldD-related protein [Candidatus Coproplasma sp.]